MATATVEPRKVEERPTVGDFVVDARRQAAHLSHEARLLKSIVADAVEDGVHAAKLAMKSVQRRVEDLGGLKDEAIRRVKRQPLQTTAAAFGVGLALGVAVGWIACRPGRRE